MTFWPFRSISRDREHLLALRIKDLEQQVLNERVYASYFRDRYERVADLILVRQVNPNAVAAVHVDTPKAEAQASVGVRVARVAGIVGNGTGITFERVPHASAAEIPSR